MDRVIKVWEDLVEGPVLTAGVDSSGKDQGRDQFIEIKLKVMVKPKEVYIFPDVKFQEDCLEWKVAQIENGGEVRNFPDRVPGTLHV